MTFYAESYFEQQLESMINYAIMFFSLSWLSLMSVATFATVYIHATGTSESSFFFFY